MTAQENRKLVENYMQAWTKNDVATLKTLLDDKYRFNNPPPGITPDKNGAIEMSAMFNKAFPDMRMNVEKVVVQDNDVAMRVIVTSTHKGEFMGIRPTNKRTEVGMLALVTVKNGKIVEDITEFDSMGLFAQLGEMPELSPATH